MRESALLQSPRPQSGASRPLPLWYDVVEFPPTLMAEERKVLYSSGLCDSSVRVATPGMYTGGGGFTATGFTATAKPGRAVGGTPTRGSRPGLAVAIGLTPPSPRTRSPSARGDLTLYAAATEGVGGTAGDGAATARDGGSGASLLERALIGNAAFADTRSLGLRPPSRATMSRPASAYGASGSVQPRAAPGAAPVTSATISPRIPAPVPKPHLGEASLRPVGGL